MSWLSTVEREVLEIVIQHSKCSMLFSKVSGDILWANSSFTEWSGYTLHELESMTWMDLSVQDGSLMADEFEAVKLVDGYIQNYSVRKKYIPKLAKPVDGILHVLRYPAYGELKFCICTWHPINEDSKEAFTLALDVSRKVSEDLQKMFETLNTHVSRSLFESTLSGIIQLSINNPKTAWILFVSFFALIGGNAGLEILLKVASLINQTKPTP